MTGRGRSRPTLDDVARSAGVSRSTASRVLNGGIRTANTISDETRAAIHAAAAALDYSANGHAQSMAAVANRTVAVLVSEIDDLGAAELVSGATETAEELGYSLVIALGGLTSDDELAAVRSIRSQRPAALLVAQSRSTDTEREAAFGAELRAFADSGGRVAIIGDNDLGFDTITLSNADAAASLADELVRLGYRRFAVVGSLPGLVTPDQRLNGFQDGLRRNGLELDEGLVALDDFDSDGGYRATGALLDRIDDIEVIVAVSDAMALGVIAQLSEHGIPVPGRVAVAGFDDVPFVRDLNPPLTTVDLPLRRMAEQATRMILGERPSEVPPPMSGTPIVRGSTPRLT